MEQILNVNQAAYIFLSKQESSLHLLFSLCTVDATDSVVAAALSDVFAGYDKVAIEVLVVFNVAGETSLTKYAKQLIVLF